MFLSTMDISEVISGPCYEEIISASQEHYIDINCSNISGIENYDFRDAQVSWDKHIISAIFGVFFFIGTVGNGLVIYVIYRVGAMTTVTNIYLGNLAAADLMFLLVCVIFTVFENLMYWPFGEIACKIVTYLMVVTMAVSVFTLTAIAIDRFLAIVHPICARNSRTMLRTTVVIILIWIACSTGLCRVFTITGVVPVWERGRFRRICFEKWPSQRDRRVYTLCVFAFLFVIPFFTMGVCYWQIRTSLMSRVRPGNSSSRAAILKATRLNKNVVKLVLAVTLLFGICWLPAHIAYIASDFSPNNLYYLKVLHVCKTIAHCLSYANSAANPVIYCFMSTNFRRQFKLAFSCGKSAARQRDDDHRNPEDEDNERAVSQNKLPSLPVMSSYIGRSTHCDDVTQDAIPMASMNSLLVPRQATYNRIQNELFL